MRAPTPHVLPTLVALAAGASAQQFDHQWLEFVRSDGLVDEKPALVSNGQHEIDFDWADLDQDGWTDLVAVRKRPFSTVEGRTNILFMNDGGVLEDRTVDYASASDVPGDAGFRTETNDRDVELADLDGDGWLDVVTATGRAEGQPKSLGHPRVHRNLGAGAGGWQGIRNEEARIPQLLNYVSGLAMNPVFCDVSAGDVSGDGFLDLYFAHYDFSNNGFDQGALEDLDDRLLVNDQTGHFSDESQQRMSPQMLVSSFGLSSQIVDINGDGHADVIKDTALGNPYYISISYNDPTNVGHFQIFHDFHNLSPYHFDTGDLNNDGKLDMVMGDDVADRYRLNQGNDALGRVIWGPEHVYSFLSGGDDGFAGQNLIVDLDGDGWNDAILCDVDTDEPGFARRANIYHNLGGPVGGQVTMLEERENDSASTPGPETGWVGAVGLTANALRGTFDVAAFDVDNDGDPDLLLGKGNGTFPWLNQTVPNPLVTDVASLSVADGGSQSFLMDAGPAHAGDLYLVLGSETGTAPATVADGVSIPLALDNWTLASLAFANSSVYPGSFGTLDADGEGQAALTIAPGAATALAGTRLHHAFAVLDAGTFEVTFASNAVRLDLER